MGVEIGAVAHAKRLRFKRMPRVEVNTHAESEIDPELARAMERIEGEAGSHTERENLPEEVEPGVTYRDVRVRWRAAARLKTVKARRGPRSRLHPGRRTA